MLGLEGGGLGVSHRLERETSASDDAGSRVDCEISHNSSGFEQPKHKYFGLNWFELFVRLGGCYTSLSSTCLWSYILFSLSKLKFN